MNLKNEETLYIKRCLQLAANGKGTCSPNPMVGSVIVYNGQIIGEGWHRKAGEPHAEPNAINSVKDKSLLSKSTMYVSLEPCSHFGKTPPCVDLIIRNEIPRVVIGTLDPFPLVSGRGVKRLREAGVEVVIGVEEEACKKLNINFFGFYTKNRPRVILKWAQTADGFIDGIRSYQDGAFPLKISTPFTQMLTHKLRSESDAILVGTHTALLDNPKLNVRYWNGKDPLRVAIDRLGVLPENSNLFDNKQHTLIYTACESRQVGHTEWQQVDLSSNSIQLLLEDLYKRKIQVLLVEGGAQLHNSFLRENLWDEIQIEQSNENVYKGVPAPVLEKEWLEKAQIQHYGEGGTLRKVQIVRNL